MVLNDKKFWRDKRVFLTGHTGFKGSWLALWLERLGARVSGYARAPQSNPSLYAAAQVETSVSTSTEADIRDLETLAKAMEQASPDIVFHLAAQSLVREGYVDPCETFSSNLMGTVHVLEAARGLDSVKGIVIVTTDKCYENREWVHPYRETDPLGGSDPYSASKACAELATSAYRRSFFSASAGMARIATARAGNVVGGGDWAADRLIPDCIRAFEAGEPVVLRNPGAIRPWQHVLEPLAGYLRLAELLCGPDGSAYAETWNLGPDAGGEADVHTTAMGIAAAWQDEAKVDCGQTDATRAESNHLRLESTKARTILGWRSVWSFTETLDKTVAWYTQVRDGADARDVTLAQIEQFEADMATVEDGGGR
ncbi:CDP-glucose 4,6-dehydratase [Roseibium album]|nr:CDP-glucose 4,6-dehydratase [Roseibium album]